MGMAVELRSAGQPRAAVPTHLLVRTDLAVLGKAVEPPAGRGRFRTIPVPLQEIAESLSGVFIFANSGQRLRDQKLDLWSLAVRFRHASCDDFNASS